MKPITLFLDSQHEERLVALARHLSKQPQDLLAQLVAKAIDEAIAENKLGAKIASFTVTQFPGAKGE